jgi:GNAT superfamily N-acetyltransferase
VADCIIRPAETGDESGAYYVCLKTGDNGQDGETYYTDDPDALGRIYVGPYLALEPELGLILEDPNGICGYAFGALDSRRFYSQYESVWRPMLCQQVPEPQGDPATWTRAQRVHHAYHHPDYFCPEPYDEFPSHLHVDLLPRAQGKGYGRLMVERIMDTLRDCGSPGAHLGASALNTRATSFYRHLGFRELIEVGSGSDRTIYMGIRLAHG